MHPSMAQIGLYVTLETAKDTKDKMLVCLAARSKLDRDLDLKKRIYGEASLHQTRFTRPSTEHPRKRRGRSSNEHRSSRYRACFLQLIRSDA